MAGHAFLPPSGADGWGNCSYWPYANQQFPKPDTPASLEGTAVHWVASECLLNWKSQAIEADLSCCDFVGRTAPNGVVITEEMAERGQAFVDTCLEIAQANGGYANMLIESPVAMPRIHPTHNWGTPDFGCFNSQTGQLYVMDYKDGFLEVDPFECLQLVDYAEGLITQFNLSDQHLTVTLGIVQPRCYSALGPVRTWSTHATTLRPLLNQLHMQAGEVFNNPQQKAGAHCVHCPGLGKCGASRRYIYTLADYLAQPVVIDEMTPADLGVEYTTLKNVIRVGKARLEAIEASVANCVDRGEPGTGYTKEVRTGAMKWDDSMAPAAVVALGDALGVDFSKADCKTPRQAIDAAKAHGRKVKDPSFASNIEATIKAVAPRAAGTSKLIKAEDSIVARIFKK